MNYLEKLNKLNSSIDNRLNWDEYFMSISLLASTRSPCNRLKVGCVIVKDNRVLSTGYNGFLPGNPHLSIVVDNHEQATVHAEQNAICHAAKNGINIKDSCVYITHYPCINCFKSLRASGIKDIYYLNNYKNDPVIRQLLIQDNTQIIQLNNVTNESIIRQPSEKISVFVYENSNEALINTSSSSGDSVNKNDLNMFPRSYLNYIPSKPIPIKNKNNNNSPLYSSI